MNSLDEHRELVEGYLAELSFAEELGGLTDAMRYSLEGGGKRIRPLLCLASGEAMGARPEQLLPAAAAIELVAGEAERRAVQLVFVRNRPVPLPGEPDLDAELLDLVERAREATAGESVAAARQP